MEADWAMAIAVVVCQTKVELHKSKKEQVACLALSLTHTATTATRERASAVHAWRADGQLKRCSNLRVPLSAAAAQQHFKNGSLFWKEYRSHGTVADWRSDWTSG